MYPGHQLPIKPSGQNDAGYSMAFKVQVLPVAVHAVPPRYRFSAFVL